MSKELSLASSIIFLFVALLFTSGLKLTEAQIGVCYGRNGDHLPSEQEAVNLYKSNNIKAMRIYDPDQATLKAVQGSGISLMLGVPSDLHNLQSLGSDPSSATNWVQTNVVPYASSIKYILVGNEVPPSDQMAKFVQPAMQNIQNALNSNNLGGRIKVSTAIKTDLIANPFPPSEGTFTDTGYINPILDFLKNNDSPLLVNVYPYFGYVGDKNINFDYALLNPTAPAVTDSGNQKQYHSLFDAEVDAVYAALSKAGAPNTKIVVSESGWPSDGGDAATLQNAGTYYKNLIGHVNQGTPLKPGPLETYLFAMFDENRKPDPPTEQHFGLFTPDQKPKYQLTFN